MKAFRLLFTSAVCLFLITSSAQAQATLSFQGILKKANGVAVDDGTYSITFSLYNQESGGTALWSETQSDVEITSGIYSIFLGSENPLNVSFNEIYYLGVKVGGSTELSPRLLLTSAPYALSLIGQSNQFPSTGTVKSDEIINAGKMAVGGTMVSNTHTMQVTGGVLARAGAPGADGANNNGFSFDNDKDSGVFSTGDGQVALYANDVEKLKVTPGNIAVTGNQTISGTLSVGDGGTPGDINISKGGAVINNGVKDWTLVAYDNFSNGDLQGWTAIVGSIFTQKQQVVNGWPDNALTQGYFLSTAGTGLMAKSFDLSGIPHNDIKVEFTIIAHGDQWDGEWIDAGFKLNDLYAVKWNAQIGGGYSNFREQIITLNDFPGDNFEVYFKNHANETEEYLSVTNIEVYVR